MPDSNDPHPASPDHDARVRAFAREHKLTEAQARKLLDEHGEDGEGLEGALNNLRHFFSAPS